MHERLNQLEGFDSRGDVKVKTFKALHKVGVCFQVLPAINRIGSLGPALIRHGRIDWKIEHALRWIFEVFQARSSLSMCF